MTALDCLLKAIHCEALARAASDRTNKQMLLATALHWRTLAGTAGSHLPPQVRSTLQDSPR